MCGKYTYENHLGTTELQYFFNKFNWFVFYKTKTKYCLFINFLFFSEAHKISYVLTLSSHPHAYRQITYKALQIAFPLPVQVIPFLKPAPASFVPPTVQALTAHRKWQIQEKKTSTYAHPPTHNRTLHPTSKWQIFLNKKTLSSLS